MPEKQLPIRANLQQYKKQAKELARACRTGEAEALARLRANHPHAPDGRVALSDAQLVIAREHGFASWAAFSAEIERRRIAAAVAELADPVDAFLRVALVPRDGSSHSGGTVEEAEAIRTRYPEVAKANVYTAAVLGDEAAVRGFVARDPEEATRAGGPYGWDALCHVCFSRYLRLDGARSDGFVATARALLDAGANANTGWWEKALRAGDADVWESALYGAAGVAHHAELTRLLLERGADPNDGETPYHVPESYDNTVLEILLKSGKVDERGKSWILARKADWHDLDGMKLALEYAANPNFVPHWGRSALQHSILRDNRIEMVKLLVEGGGDPLVTNTCDGRNALQLAARRGRGDVLRLFAERGFDVTLDGVDALIAVCAMGEGARVDALTAAAPRLRDVLLADGGELLGTFAGVGNAEGVRCLLDLGVPVDARNAGDVYFDTAKDSTALHVAAWRGNPEVMRLLIERGADVNARDGKGRTPLQLSVGAGTESYWKGRRKLEWVESLVRAGASAEGIEMPTGWADADDVLRQAQEGR